MENLIEYPTFNLIYDLLNNSNDKGAFSSCVIVYGYFLPTGKWKVSLYISPM